jgi:hypothetical protein
MNLLTCDNATGHFTVCELAASKLLKLERDFHPIAVAGCERVGKSTTCSWLSDHCVFPTETGTAGFTKAVWVADQVSESGLLVMDFEGFALDPVHNNRLFVLAVLMSDVLVFNTAKTIMLDALDKLTYAGTIAKKAGPGGGSSPALLWILRDYNLGLSAGNDPYDKLDYLLHSINANETVAGGIRSLFSGLACYSLPPPLEDIPTGSRTVPKNMVASFANIRAQLVRLCRPKQTLRGPEFVHLVRQMCNVVNSSADQDMDVSTAWQSRLQALAASKRAQRQIAISRQCREQCQEHSSGFSPAKFDQFVQIEFTLEERFEFEELFTEERELVEKEWIRKTEIVLATVTQMFSQLDSQVKIAQFLRDVVSTYEPKELIETAVSALLPDLAKKITAAAEEAQRREQSLSRENLDLQSRHSRQEQLATERSEWFRERLDELQKTLLQQHKSELELKEQELQQEHLRANDLDLRLGTIANELTTIMTELFETRHSLEETLSCRDDLDQRLEAESLNVKSLKRKIEDLETCYSQTTNDLRGQYENRTRQLEMLNRQLSEDLQQVQDRLQQTTQEYQIERSRSQELENLRNNLHAENMSLRTQLFQAKVPSTNELAVQSELAALRSQVCRLKKCKVESIKK